MTQRIKEKNMKQKQRDEQEQKFKKVLNFAKISQIETNVKSFS